MSSLFVDVTSSISHECTKFSSYLTNFLSAEQRALQKCQEEVEFAKENYQTDCATLSNSLQTAEQQSNSLSSSVRFALQKNDSLKAKSLHLEQNILKNAEEKLNRVTEKNVELNKKLTNNEIFFEKILTEKTIHSSTIQTLLNLYENRLKLKFAVLEKNMRIAFFLPNPTDNHNNNNKERVFFLDFSLDSSTPLSSSSSSGQRQRRGRYIYVINSFYMIDKTYLDESNSIENISFSNSIKLETEETIKNFQILFQQLNEKNDFAAFICKLRKFIVNFNQ